MSTLHVYCNSDKEGIMTENARLLGEVYRKGEKALHYIQLYNKKILIL